MKAGTTWLYAVLERHPELFFTPEKELHYFYHAYVNPNLLNSKRRLLDAREKHLFRFDPEKANIDRIRQNLHWVSAYLSSPVDDLWYRGLFAGMRHQRYGCDFSNLYALLPSEAWTRIHSNCDTLRVLYTLRHPVKRLWSHVKFHLQVTNSLGHLESWAPKDYSRFMRKPFIWDNAEYGQALRRMRAGLPEDALKVIFFEDLHADQRGMLAEIEEFLGIAAWDYPAGLLSRRVNESTSRPMPAFFPGLVQDDVARIIGEVEDQGLTVPESWHKPTV